MSMHDLAAATGNADKFRPRVSEVYAPFSEGLDTADLVGGRPGSR
jgi:hypothetical protein